MGGGEGVRQPLGQQCRNPRSWRDMQSWVAQRESLELNLVSLQEQNLLLPAKPSCSPRAAFWLWIRSKSEVRGVLQREPAGQDAHTVSKAAGPASRLTRFELQKSRKACLPLGLAWKETLAWGESCIWNYQTGCAKAMGFGDFASCRSRLETSHKP